MSFHKIDGEQATALAAVEAEMEVLHTNSEQQFNILQDKVKAIVYPILGVTKEEGDKKMMTLVAKYYPTHGFYMAEIDDETSIFNNFSETSNKPTRH